jgi:FkbM family methyltransferase
VPPSHEPFGNHLLVAGPVSVKHPLLSLFRYWQRHPIARRDLPGTVFRFLRWQLGTRLLEMPVVVPWIGTTSLVIERGMTGATMNVYCGLHEAADMAFVLHLLRPADRFLDIGANVGTYTILASGVARAHSITLEPIPATYASLQRNLRLNNLHALVDSHCQAVGAEPGSLRFTAARGPMNRVVTGSSLSTTEATVEVPVTTVDQLLTGIPAPLLWKVDVEGFEPQVLQGAAQALHNPPLKAVLLEADTPALRATMAEAGFSRFVYDPFSRLLQPLSAATQASSSHNQLWIRDLSFVQQRCRTAAPVRVGRVSL